MIKSDPHISAFGSSFDPLLHGVARGLADLFPLPEQETTVARPQEEVALEPQDQRDEQSRA